MTHNRIYRDDNWTGIACYPTIGDCRNSQGEISTDRLFTGQRLDDTGLYYYGARYYDAGIGRFISADTIVQSFSNPQTLNRYSYVTNNPLKYTDPTGHVKVSDDGGTPPPPNPPPKPPKKDEPKLPVKKSVIPSGVAAVLTGSIVDPIPGDEILVGIFVVGLVGLPFLWDIEYANAEKYSIIYDDAGNPWMTQDDYETSQSASGQPGDQNEGKPHSPQKIDLKRFEKQYGNAHTFKEGHLGEGAKVSSWDIKYDKTTQQLWLYNKNTKVWMPTGDYYKP